jgi:TolB protein
LTTDANDDRKARWSPDGRWLVFVSTRSGSEGLWRARTDGGTPELLVEPAYAPIWSWDGKWIYYLSLAERNTNLWAVSVDGATRRQLTDLRGRRGTFSPDQAAFAADRSYLYFLWQEDHGDLWVADVSYPRPWE